MTTVTARSHILILGDPVRKEGVANAAITPGMLVEQMSTGKFRKHATADGNCYAKVAFETDFYGGGTGATLAIDQAYAADDILLYGILRPGDEWWAVVAAGAAAIEIGDPLVSDGAGGVKKFTATTIDQAGSGS